MNPDVAWATLITTADIQEWCDTFVALRDWINNGGFAPRCMDDETWDELWTHLYMIHSWAMRFNLTPRR